MPVLRCMPEEVLMPVRTSCNEASMTGFTMKRIILAVLVAAAALSSAAFAAEPVDNTLNSSFNYPSY